MFCLLLLPVALAGSVTASGAEDMREPSGAAQSAGRNPVGWEKGMLGYRIGTSNDHNEEFYYKSELFGALPLPLAWRIPSGWRFAFRLDFIAGVLNGGTQWGFLGGVGPTFTLLKEQWRLALDIGTAPAFLSRHRFGPRDNLGGHFQFYSHSGLTWLLRRNLTVGYQWQHVSNADIYESNPGINFHSLQVVYVFW
jgi:hypothetical protein